VGDAGRVVKAYIALVIADMLDAIIFFLFAITTGTICHHDSASSLSSSSSWSFIILIYGHRHDEERDNLNSLSL